MNTIIKNALVYSNGEFTKKNIYINGERFCDEIATNNAVDAKGLMAIPGLIDIHFHGCVGSDICDANHESIEKIAKYQQENGILAICPATMTYPEEKLSSIAETVSTYKSDIGADLVGINMEGPFISPNKVGAQNPLYLHTPDIDMFMRLQEKSNGMFKLCDIAPELPGAMEFIERLNGNIPAISIAHTETDYDTACKAFSLGVNHITHCYNAMLGISHRMPGPIIAALENKADIELITDGVHVHPAIVRMTFQLFSDEHVILISDSMMACGLSDGQYSLGGQAVTVCGRKATLTEKGDVIAGSASNLYQCMCRAVKEMGIPLESAIKAATHNPARSIGIDRDYGDIEIGKYANLLLIDQDFQIHSVIKKGAINCL